MSIHDTPRTYADPREVVARAIYEGRNGKGAVPLSRQNVAQREAYREDATAAIDALLTHGFLSEHYFDAMKARNGK